LLLLKILFKQSLAAYTARRPIARFMHPSTSLNPSAPSTPECTYGIVSRMTGVRVRGWVKVRGRGRVRTRGWVKVRGRVRG